MIDAKKAVMIAKESAKEMLQQPTSSLEEIERDSYKDREVWCITLGLPRDLRDFPDLPQFGEAIGMREKMLSVFPLQYKRFLIDADTGELVAMKLREAA
jgi:hypothetical protein